MRYPALVTPAISCPFSRHAYYRGRFFAIRDLSLECTKAGLRIDRLKTVVHFPPIPPGPLVGIYHCFDRWFQRHSVPGGGVILCVAIKPE